MTWDTSVPILIFLGLSVLELGPMYATERRQRDRQTDVRRQTKASLNACVLWGQRHKMSQSAVTYLVKRAFSIAFQMFAADITFSHARQRHIVPKTWTDHPPPEAVV